MSAPADGRPAGRVREVFPAEGQEGRDQAQADEGKAETARQGEQSSLVNISTGVAKKFQGGARGRGGWGGGGSDPVFLGRGRYLHVSRIERN